MSRVHAVWAQGDARTVEALLHGVSTIAKQIDGVYARGPLGSSCIILAVVAIFTVSRIATKTYSIASNFATCLLVMFV
jgi:hypothetical protein